MLGPSNGGRTISDLWQRRAYKVFSNCKWNWQESVTSLTGEHLLCIVFGGRAAWELLSLDLRLFSGVVSEAELGGLFRLNNSVPGLRRYAASLHPDGLNSGQVT